MQIGSAAEMVLLSFALAYRLNLLREENVALELASRCNLELRVEQRTAALSDAIFGRYGGEEFVVLQRDANGKSVAALAERIRADVAALDVGPTGRVPLTLSIGHALARADDEHWDRTLERADAALHAAKQQGRNRVAAA